MNYHIASRVTQSNSAYVSVLKIPIVLADASDGVSKSVASLFFLRERPLLRAGQNILFHENNGYKQRLGPPVPKRRQFSDLFSWPKVLK